MSKESAAAKKRKMQGLYLVLCAAFIACGLWYAEAEPGVELPELQPFSAELPATYEITVEVSGEVMYPGFYAVQKNTSLSALISLSGGFTNDADEGRLNMEDALFDGECVYVPAKGEAVRALVSYSKGAPQKNELVNINRAGKEELKSLPGVGNALSSAIFEFRLANGRFMTKEGIMRVPGIGESLFEDIKDRITVEE